LTYFSCFLKEKFHFEVAIDSPVSFGVALIKECPSSAKVKFDLINYSLFNSFKFEPRSQEMSNDSNAIVSISKNFALAGDLGLTFGLSLRRVTDKRDL
jgi:hypothetical protein